MRYRIDQGEFSEFLDRQVRLVERLPVEATEASADGYGDGLDDAEREAVWLAAGIEGRRDDGYGDRRARGSRQPPFARSSPR
jgi:hypothetical protein